MTAITTITFLYYYPQNGVIDNQSITLNAFDKPLVTMENAEEIQISGIRFTGTTNSGITMTDCEVMYNQWL